MTAWPDLRDPAVLDDADLYGAVHAAVDPVVRAARRHGPLPGLRSRAFVAAPQVVQRAVLLVCGEAWLLGEELLDTWLDADYTGGLYHRSHLFPGVCELDRRRWPPDGDRELWVRYGPAGPPARGEAS